MNNEPFHVMAHDWRYNSRQKALGNSLHLAQLPEDFSGETVLIAPAAPDPDRHGGGYPFPPMPVPPGPFSGSGQIITNKYFTTDVYGSVAFDGTITAQNKMGIDISSDIIIMTPSESGIYLIHAEAQSDLHTIGYEGPSGDGKLTVQLFNGSDTPVAYNDSQILMSGGDWGAQYLDSLLRTECDALVYSSGAFIARAIGLGSGWLSMWAMKIADDV